MVGDKLVPVERAAGWRLVVYSHYQRAVTGPEFTAAALLIVFVFLVAVAVLLIRAYTP